MPNDYFQFKQFTIKQDKSAMKVTTDACLFGAWIADKFKEVEHPSAPVVLDIGTGTGLLALMLAQQIKANIDAVEIDPGAFAQASENIAVSSWREQITVIHSDARDHAFNKTYDLIISNPPFYEKALRSTTASINDARHDTSLLLEELLLLVRGRLKYNGYFGIIIPYQRYKQFSKEANSHLVPVHTTLVKPTPKHEFTRAMILYQLTEDTKAGTFEELVIKEVHHSYTDAFVHYLKDYYLSL